MIVATRTKIEGRVITLVTEPFVNVVGFSAFAENIVAGTGSFTSKTFRYSTDGINYVDYADISTLTSLVTLESDLLIFEFQYTRDVVTSTINITTIDLTETLGTFTIDNTYFDKFPFSNFFSSLSPEVLAWLVNVLQKIYETGQLQLPAYIGRLDEGENNDKFIEVFKPIIQYFAYYVILARQYQQFHTIPFLLEEFLLERGLWVTQDDITNTFDIPNAGTGETLATLDLGPVDVVADPNHPAGTRMRFVVDGIELTFADLVGPSFGLTELAFAITTNTDYSASAVNISGDDWVIRVTAPVGSGSTLNTIEAIWVYPAGNFYADFAGGAYTDVTATNSGLYLMENYYSEIAKRGTQAIEKEFNLYQTTYTNGELLRLIQHNKVDDFVLNFHLPQHFGWNLRNSSPLYRGVGINLGVQKAKGGIGDRIKVYPVFSYEYTFKIQNQSELKVELWYRDAIDSRVDLLNHSDSSVLNIPLDIDLYRTDKYTYVRIIVYSVDREDEPSDLTNLNQGNNVKFQLSPNNINNNPDYNLDYNNDYLVLGSSLGAYTLEIKITDNAGIDISSAVEDFKMNPVFTHYSHGVIQTANWMSNWLVNNNQEFRTVELRQFIRKYLVNYNSHHEIVLPTYDGG